MNDATFVRDRLDITNLIHSYSHHADHGDLAGFAGLFRDDAVVDIGFPGITDKTSLVAMLGRRPEGGPQTRHVMSNLVFHSQSEAEASGALYFTVVSTEQGKLSPMVAGRYTFTVARAGQEWKLSRWRAELDGTPG